MTPTVCPARDHL